MDAIEQLKVDLREGRIDADRVIDLMVTLQRQLQAANKQIEELQMQLGRSATAKVDEPFSVRAEEKRQEARGKKKRKSKNQGRRGRVKTADKVKRAERTEDVFPEDVDRNECKLSHVRPVWRLEEGRAVLIAYRIYRGPNNRYGQIGGVLGRSEFGLEIVLEIAYLVYVVGLSFDKVCQLLHFFQNLQLRKSQPDALLDRLARHWEKEFDALCTLLANSLVVHADETSWSLNSVWAFLSEKARVLLFGVHKDGDTLKKFLDPASFAGIVVSDDAAVYGNFTQGQKCWAHLLRKAIKLTLQEPDNAEYREFTDRLLALYRKACRVQRDGRLGDAGRSRKVSELENELRELCEPMWLAEFEAVEGPADCYRRLVNELMKLLLAQELFRFVTAKPVEQLSGDSRPVAGTNNEAERALRSPAQARDTGRTDKSYRGCRRRSIITSVFESLRLHLSSFTLENILSEITRWSEIGHSCFTDLVAKLRLRPSKTSVLDQVIPIPDS